MAVLEGFASSEPFSVPTVDVLSFVYEYERDAGEDVEKPVYFDAADSTRWLSKRTARATVRKIIAGLRHHGLVSGDCVLINSFNDINYTLLVQGIVGAGGIFTGANPSYTSDELLHQVKVAEVKFIITEPEMLPAISKAAQEAGIPSWRLWIFDNLPTQKVPLGAKSWTELQSHGEADWNRLTTHQQVENTTACLLMSSGTTGPSKAVKITHHNLNAQYMGVWSHNRSPYQRRYVFATPVFHAAMVPQLHFHHFRDGREVYLMRRFDLHTLLRKIQDVRATEMILVPAMVITMLPDLKSHKYDLSSVKSVLIGAAPLDKSIQDRFRQSLAPGTRVVQGWGMSEMCCTGTQFSWPEDDTTGSVGRRLNGLEFMLLDKEGNRFRAYDKPGELLVRGPTVTRGYHLNPTANAESFIDGWFRTGDICLCDSSSKKWYIVGRDKELIKVRGFQVAPIEIEAVLMSHPDILDAAIIGIPVPALKKPLGQELSSEELAAQALGERVRAYVMVRPGRENEVTAKDVIEYAAARLAGYKRITGGVAFVKEIPKNAYGKILRRVLREQFEKDESNMPLRANL